MNRINQVLAYKFVGSPAPVPVSVCLELKSRKTWFKRFKWYKILGIFHNFSQFSWVTYAATELKLGENKKSRIINRVKKIFYQFLTLRRFYLMHRVEIAAPKSSNIVDFIITQDIHSALWGDRERKKLLNFTNRRYTRNWCDRDGGVSKRLFRLVVSVEVCDALRHSVYVCDLFEEY